MPATQQELREFVNREVYLNQSSLVDMFILKEIATLEDLENYYDGEEEETREVFEWWVVSDWLLKRLREKGEVVLETDFGSWWGRGTTGQAIFLDSVIEEIYQEINPGS